MSILKSLNGLVDSFAEEPGIGWCKRFIKITARLESLRQRGHAIVGHADLQCRPVHHRGPSSGSLDSAVLGQGGLQAVIEKASRQDPIDECSQGIRVDGLLDHGGGVLTSELTIKVPIGIQLLRVYLAKTQVIAEPGEGVGQQQVDIRTTCGGNAFTTGD